MATITGTPRDAAGRPLLAGGAYVVTLRTNIPVRVGITVNGDTRLGIDLSPSVSGGTYTQPDLPDDYPDLQGQVIVRAGHGNGSPTVYDSGWFDITNGTIDVDSVPKVASPIAIETSAALIAEMESLRDQTAAATGVPGAMALTDADAGSAFRVQQDARLSETFVPLANLVPLPETAAGHKYQRDVLTATVTGPMTLTLGADPEPGSELVAVNGVVLADGYTLADRDLTLDAVTSADVVLVKYAHPADQTATPAVVVVTLVSDDFDRADGDVGNADTGQTWIEQSGNWVITSGQAHSSTLVAGQKSAIIDAGASDCTVQVTIPTAGADNVGLCLRSTDVANQFETFRSSMNRRVANAATTVISFSEEFVSGDTMRAVLAGDTITIYRDAGSTGTFTEVGSTTDSFNLTQTRHGIRQSGTAADSRLDNFRVWA